LCSVIIISRWFFSTRERAFLGRSPVPRRAGRSASGHACSGRHAGAHRARQRKPLRMPPVWDGDVVIRYLPPYTAELNPVGGSGISSRRRPQTRCTGARMPRGGRSGGCSAPGGRGGRNGSSSTGITARRHALLRTRAAADFPDRRMGRESPRARSRGPLRTVHG